MYHLGRLTAVMSRFEFAFENILFFFEIDFKLLFEYATMCPKPSNYNIIWRACIQSHNAIRYSSISTCVKASLTFVKHSWPIQLDGLSVIFCFLVSSWHAGDIQKGMTLLFSVRISVGGCVQFSVRVVVIFSIKILGFGIWESKNLTWHCDFWKWGNWNLI